MSHTSIYCLGERPGFVAEFGNSWRGAMYVWNDIARRYCGLGDGFPIFDKKACDEFWDCWKRYPLKRHEKIVLFSTYDRIVASGSELPDVIEAFKRYGSEHPDSSILEQAIALETHRFDRFQFAAWNQTSINSFWGWIYDETDDDEGHYYDPNVSSEHERLFQFEDANG